MKVLLINGSPNEKGCTYTALREAADTIEKEGITAEIFWLGIKPVMSCTDCGGCTETHRCIFSDDPVNTILEKAEKSDGFIFGTPVHYAQPSGMITACLSRAFYAGNCFEYKPGAAVVSCRRGGSATAFDALNKFFTIANMPVVSSQYWNEVHGNTPEEVRQDAEGLQTMRTLGRNMAWLLKCIQAGRNSGILLPAQEEHIATNFIR